MLHLAACLGALLCNLPQIMHSEYATNIQQCIRTDTPSLWSISIPGMDVALYFRWDNLLAATSLSSPYMGSKFGMCLVIHEGPWT